MNNDIDFYIDSVQNQQFLSNYRLNGFFGPFKPYQENVFNSKNFIVKQKNYLVDDINSYIINSNGFRGKNFCKNVNILSAGCSVTFGVGVPEFGTWSNILQNKTNKSVDNISFPGGSVSHICNLIVRYCMLYGNPKNIFFFAPSLTRGYVVNDKNFYHSGKWESITNENNLTFKSSDANIFFVPKENKLSFIKNSDYSKDSIENRVSPHQFIYESLQSLFMLESYCFTNNINLVWSTWSNTSIFILKTLTNLKDFYLKKYVEFEAIKETMYDYNDIVLLCKENHNSEFKNEIFWNTGTDKVIRNGKSIKEYNGHPGVHFHYHVAEFFEKFTQ